MKKLKFLVLLLLIFFATINTYSQLWKQYSDSAKAFNDQKKGDKAIEYYTKAKEELQKDSMWTISHARTCNSIGELYYNKGQYAKAEPLYVEANKIMEKVFGKEHPDYAKSCNNLATSYIEMGQYENAEPLLIESKLIREKSLGKEHPDYAKSCNNLAILYLEMGQYKKAEPLYLESKNIREKVLGKESPVYATACGNLADFYRIMGQYEKAEPLSIEAKQIREKVLGKEHPDYARSCGVLANLYEDMGQYEKAEPLFLEAKQIREKVLGKEHPAYMISCTNLANIYWDMGQIAKAEPLYLEVKLIIEKMVGKENPDYAISCNNLGVLYEKVEQYEKAELLHLEAKNIREKIFGKEHLNYASSCYSLASLYSTMGQYKKAEPLFLEAKQINEKVQGKLHPNNVHYCNNLGLLYWNLKDYNRAHDFFIEAFTIQYNGVKKIFQFTSEKEKQSYLKNITDLGENSFSFNATAWYPSRQGFTYDVSLTNRNLILSSSQQLRQAIYNSNDTNVKNKYYAWMNSREQTSFWYTKPITDRPAYVKKLEEQANTLEKELTRLSSDFKKEQSNNEFTWKNIQQSLKTNETAIEFKEFNYFDGKRWTDSIYYIALVLRKDKPEPELVQLFEKKQLDSLLSYKKTSPGQQKLNVLYSVQEKTTDKNSRKSLYDLIWQPLEEKLKGISKVYYAPAGSLYKIAFAALPVNNKEVLSDKYQLVQLNTTASVVDQLQASVSASNNIILYGGVQYDADSTSIKKAALQFNQNDVATRSLPEDLLREGVGDFYYLKGSEQEVNQIEKLANQNKYSAAVSNGMMATEESFKNLSGKNSPAVLHIATHGFFFPDPKNEKKDERIGGAVVFKQSDNPLIRSGLALAGANNAWRGKPVTGVEDGILTSYEVSNMYLPNTKLVVLSACETGLGDIQGSEGVYGLQRAFKMAGVQNLMMSLWKVDDKAASEFMQVFYKNLFAKQTINDAFNNAQTNMKNKYRTDPYKWAAWVLVR